MTEYSVDSMDQVVAALCAIDHTLDEAEVRKSLAAEARQVVAGADGIEAAFAGVLCRSWWTISCTIGNPPQQGTFLRRAAGGREPIGWGGSRCTRFGPCEICFHYECRKT